MYAIVEVNGKQHKVEEGSIFYSDLVGADEGEKVSLRVVSFYDDKELKVGAPYLDSSVSAEVIKNDRAKKITVFKYKPKKNYKRKIGHRQSYSKLKIISIR